MPVHVAASGATASAIHLTCDGAMPLTISNSSGGLDVTAPWLAISSSLQNASWADAANHPLAIVFQPLSDEQRLVGLVGVDAPEARTLFPASELVSVHLDPANPLPGPPAAWESLDGLVLDANAAAKVTDAQLRTLLAAGTTVAIRSDQRPGGNWPLQRKGAFWVVSHSRLLPPSLIVPAAYGPTYGWLRGTPDSLRRQTVLAGVVVSLLLIGMTLLRGRRRRIAGVFSVAILSSIGCLLWQRNHPPVNRLTAGVVINEETVSQRDQWTWISSPVAVDYTFPADGLTHPIFFTHASVTGIPMRIECAGGAQPAAFKFHLEPGVAIAFVSSTVDSKIDEHPIKASASPFAAMAGDVYGLAVRGEYVDDAGETTVVLTGSK
jgi:hypothetical protein